MRIIEAADRRDNNRDAVTGANVTVGGGSGIGPDLFRKACEFGLEGLVSKRADRPYRGGRCNHWIKVKNRNSPAMQRADEIEWR
jgi:ATP-dependent DNA ligase